MRIIKLIQKLNNEEYAIREETMNQLKSLQERLDILEEKAGTHRDKAIKDKSNENPNG